MNITYKMEIIMKEFFTCCSLWCKRILKRPLFLLTLLLMPLSSLFLQNCRTREDAVLKAALYIPDAEHNASARELTEQLIQTSNHSISYYYCSSKKELRQDVSSGKANCGYIFPRDLDSALKTYAKKHKPFITSIRPNQNTITSIIDEIILGKSYQKISYHILQAFLCSKTLSVPNDADLTELFSKHTDSELLFQFEYMDKTKNENLNHPDSNFILTPIRGITAVFILLACMAGGLLWYSDQKNKLLPFLTQRKQLYFRILSLLVPGFLASVIGLLTISLTGISRNPKREFLSMTVYLLACIALTDVLRTLCRKREYFLAAIPFFTIGSFILCPVFADISIILAKLSYLRTILPANYYLNTLHSSADIGYLFLYAAILFMISFLLQRGIPLLLQKLKT